MLVLLLLLESSLLCISFLNIPQFYHKQKKVQNHHIIFSNYGTKDPSIDLFISTSNTNTNLNNFSMDRTKVVDNNDDGLLNFDEEPSSMDYNTKMKLVKSIIDTDTSLLEELVPILVQKEDDIKILIKALSGCRSNSDWRTAFSLYQYSKKLLMMGMFSEQKKENYNYATSVITSSAKIERIPPVIYGQCLVALARGGAEVQAYQVLCEMLESGVAPNLVTMDNIILELSSRGAYKVIIEMIEQLTRFRSETAVSNVALNALLNACNRVEAYDSIVYSYQRFIAVERESNHIVLDKIGFSVLLKACDRIEDAITPIEAFYRIVRHSPNGGLSGVDNIITKSSLQRMMAICLKTNSRDIAMEFMLRIEKDDWSVWHEEPHFSSMFQQLLSEETKGSLTTMDPRLYSAMIAILSAENYTIDKAYELFEHYRDNKGILDESMFTSLIFAQRKRGDHNMASKIFEDLLDYTDAVNYKKSKSECDSIVSVASCNALLTVYSECNIDENRIQSSGLQKKTDELFDIMKTRNIPWNPQTYYALMLGQNNSGMVIQLWHQMKAQQKDNGSKVLNKAVTMETLKACVEEGNGRLALEILQDVQQLSRSNQGSPFVLPDMPMYVLGLNAMQNDPQGRSNETMRLLNMMKESELKPNLKVYNVVFGILQKALDWRNSMGMLFQMFLTGQKVNPKIVNSVLITCSKSQQWDLVLRLFDEISTIRSPNTMRLFDMTSVSCSVHASIKLGNSNATRNLLQQALLLNETISSSALRYAATIFDKEDLTSDSEWLFDNFVGGHLDPWTVDLHGYSSSVAKGAVLSALSLIKDETEETDIVKNMIIITGRGKHSGGSKSLLKPVLQSWLRSCFDPPLQAAELSENPGRLIISKELLYHWTQQQSSKSEIRKKK